MKEATTQEIIRDAPITKEFGEHWEITYMRIGQSVEKTDNYRIFRNTNSLLFYEIVEPKLASGVVFSIDPPRIEAEAYVEFCKALSKAGFEELIVHAKNQLIKKLLDQAGFFSQIANVEKSKNGKEQFDLQISLHGGDQQ
jgi:hypothetical protein